jgi:transcriptional regulator with XRE-family HTH domain
MDNRIKFLRIEKGMKQSELARYLKVAQSTLSGWETGKYEVDNENLKKMADLFGCSIDLLLGRTHTKNHNDINPYIMLNEKLRTLRIAKGKTQNEVANMLGIDRTTYTKYETGDSNPDYSTICELADYFNVTVDYLLGRSVVTAAVQDYSEQLDKRMREMLSDPDLRVAFYDLEAMTDEEKEGLIIYLETMKARRERKQ